MKNKKKKKFFFGFLGLVMKDTHTHYAFRKPTHENSSKIDSFFLFTSQVREEKSNTWIDYHERERERKKRNEESLYETQKKQTKKLK